MAVVLVAGGTGFIGSHIAHKLIGQGHSVVVLSRNPNRARRTLPAGVELRQGDVTDSPSLEAAMAGVDTVVCAVQFPNHPVENPGKGHTYLKVDGEGTTRLVQAAKVSGVRRFIYIGGAGTREGQTAPWFIGKLMAEAAVRQSGLAYTIIRPSWVYGPDDRTLNKFVAFARMLPIMPVIGNGQTKAEPVFVDDVAAVVAQSVTLDAAVNQTYEIGGPEVLTMDQIVQTVMQTMGKKRPLVHQPAWFMKLVSIPMGLLPNPPLSPAAVDFVLMEEPVDNGPLLRDFGIRLTPLALGLSYLKAKAGH